jgi:hypothetical protein
LKKIVKENQQKKICQKKQLGQALNTVAGKLKVIS